MAGRPAATAPPSPAPSAVRLEVLKELQALVDDQELRARLEHGPLAEVKGREPWVLHLLLRAHEVGQAQTSNLIGSAYSQLGGRLKSVEGRLARLEELQQNLGEDVRARIEGLSATLADRVVQQVDHGLAESRDRLASTVLADLDTKWRPIGESVETFARSSHQLSKDLSDTYRVATQTRLLLNESARRMIDLGRDLVALEEGLKLSLTKILEESLQPLEERIAALEGRLGVAEVAGEPRPADGPPSD